MLGHSVLGSTLHGASSQYLETLLNAVSFELMRKYTLIRAPKVTEITIVEKIVSRKQNKDIVFFGRLSGFSESAPFEDADSQSS